MWFGINIFDLMDDVCFCNLVVVENYHSKGIWVNKWGFGVEWKIINNLSGGNLQNITNKIIGMGSDHSLYFHRCQLILTSNT